MAIRVVRLGTKRLKGEGPRIGTVRRPPRGVPKSEYASQDWYDVWLPDVAPTPDLMKLGVLSNRKKTGAHLRGNIDPRWPIRKKAGLSICLPSCLTSRTSPWDVIAKTRRGATGPYCGSYWRKEVPISNEAKVSSLKLSVPNGTFL